MSQFQIWLKSRGDLNSVLNQIEEAIQEIPEIKAITSQTFEEAIREVETYNQTMGEVYDTSVDLIDRLRFGIDYITQHGIIVQAKHFCKMLHKHDIARSTRLQSQGELFEYIEEVLAKNVILRQTSDAKDDQSSSENESENSSSDEEHENEEGTKISPEATKQREESRDHKCRSPQVIIMRKTIGQRRYVRVPWRINQHANIWYEFAHEALQFTQKYERLMMTNEKSQIIALREKLVRIITLDSEDYEIIDLVLDITQEDEVDNMKIETTKEEAIESR